MFKTISAALLAVSVLAAPALAATSGKTDEAPLTKQSQVKSSAKSTTKAGVTTGAKMGAKTGVKTSAKTAVKPSVLNANAKMGGHHVTHHKHYRHLSHHKTLKTHTKVSLKQVKPVSKRG